MANRNINKARNNGFFRLPVPSDGQLDSTMIGQLSDTLTRLQQIFANGISVGDGGPSTAAGNMNGQWVVHVFGATPNVVEQIPHGLRALPTFAKVMLSDRACSVYDPQFRVGWGASNIQLACNTASAKVLIWVQA